MSNVAAAIYEASKRWMNAWIDLDYKVLEDVMAADFTLVVSAMPAVQMERARWLAACERYRCTEFHYRDVQVRQVGADIAVMSAIAEQRAELEGVDRSGAFWLTDVWRLNDGGQWQVCARYSSRPEGEGQSSSALNRLNQGASQAPPAD